MRPRPGWGARHPDVAEFLATHEAVAEERTAWPNGDGIAARVFATVDPIPDAVVSSVRCLVRVGDDAIVLCRNAHDVRHAWPGGGREAGETFAETACREVHEETGWRLDPNTLEQLGWLHLENVTPVQSDHPYPNPDCFHAVLVGFARERDGGRDVAWTDTEGYELSSELALLADAADLIEDDPLSAVFVRLFVDRLGPLSPPTPPPGRDRAPRP
jgi:ADP-ribose pyrophosphatase YjhB (NUDIX family)